MLPLTATVRATRSASASGRVVCSLSARPERSQRSTPEPGKAVRQSTTLRRRSRIRTTLLPRAIQSPGAPSTLTRATGKSPVLVTAGRTVTVRVAAGSKDAVRLTGSAGHGTPGGAQ